MVNDGGQFGLLLKSWRFHVQNYTRQQLTKIDGFVARHFQSQVANSYGCRYVLGRCLICSHLGTY